MNNNAAILKEAAEVYKWLQQELETNPQQAGKCLACGKCCDFDTFDHRLFVTSPELIFLVENLKPDQVRKMTKGCCPYNIDGKCGIYDLRFAGCRIFSCKGSSEFQANLSEASIARFKSICDRFETPYFYTDLKTALNSVKR